MQIGIWDVRQLGNLKIYKSLPSDALQKIKDLNYELYDIKCTAYGFPLVWSNLRESLKYNYKGMYSFMYYCEPMVDNIDVSGKSKDSAPLRRRFRNKWVRLWSSVAHDLLLSEQDNKVLMDLGVRLAFVDGERTVPDWVYRMYNSFIEWSMLTQYESNLSASGMSMEGAINALVLKDGDEFIKMLLKEEE